MNDQLAKELADKKRGDSAEQWRLWEYRFKAENHANHVKTKYLAGSQ